MSASPILEFYTFKLKEGSNEQEFHEKHDRLIETFFRQQAGFSSSQIWKTSDGNFALVNTWRDMDCANAAAKSFESFDSPIGGEWYAFVDTETEQLSHYTIERRDF